MAAILAEPPADFAAFSCVAIRYIHYWYPAALFVWFVASQTATICTLATLSAPKRDYRKRLWILLQLAIIASYVGEAVLLCVQALAEKDFDHPDDVIYLLTAIMAWGIAELAMIDTEKPVWYPYYGCWTLAIAAEICLLSLALPNKKGLTSFEIAKFCVEGLRILAFLTMPIGMWVIRDKDREISAEESARLLGPEQIPPPNYGSVADSDSDAEETREARAKMLKKIEESGNWWTYAKSFSIFWPYIWPKGELWLQFCMVLVGICLLAERGLNVMVPHQLGVVTNALMRPNGPVPWIQLTLYVIFRWLDSGSGIQALQTYLWMPIDQYSHCAITVAAYNHVMSLSHDFHSNKKTGDIWSSIAQGRSINGFIDSICFQVIPMLADLIVAFGYFYFAFDIYMALIVAIVSVVYLWVTFKLSAMRNYLRRDLNTTARNEISILIETVSSWTTVSYFNRIPYEQDRYHGAIRMFQKAERKWLIGLSVLNVAQSLIFTIGLLAASFLAVYGVTKGTQPVGSFVTLLSYWAQLSSPLSFFANFYRKVQTQMLDAERLLELFQTKPTIADNPRAIELEKVNGEIDFENVCFSYDPRKPAITDVSFKVPAGSTVAFVGETGGGKTTCLKLLFRFYDVASGAIKIDGHDIRDIKLSSLREHMGVVPQDPQLFNDTIMSNIKYANFNATDEDVYAACRAASIHEKILSFPDGYLSKVGERGIKLSGGELQRVSIARAILKNPKIILLDEATSMIDMETEHQIQAAFKRLSRDRTMFVVAHRLSTIMNADLIIVIKEGRIVENGSHEQLLRDGGRYFQLWSKQSKPKEPPTPKPEAKVPRLIDELFDSLDSDDASGTTTPSSRKSQQVGIPEALKTASRSATHPTVTFSLPERTIWNPQFQFQPLLNPRIATPNHGILKKVSSMQGSSNTQGPVTSISKATSALKPDAKEFVPMCLPIVAQHPTQCRQPAPKAPIIEPEHSLTRPLADQFSGDVTRHTIVAEPSRIETIAKEESPTGQKLTQEANAMKPVPIRPITEDEQTPAVAQTEAPNKGELTGHLKGHESCDEELGNADMDNPQDPKKRRRRIRRRSVKPKSGEQDGSGQNGSFEGSDAVVPIAVSSTEDEQNQLTDGEFSGANGSISKSKRRFRGGSKPKSNGLESESEGGPLSIIRPADNVPGQSKPRSRAESATGTGTRASGKEDQLPQGAGQPQRQSDSVPPTSKREPMQRRNSGSMKGGSWHKGHKKSKSTESGNSVSES